MLKLIAFDQDGTIGDTIPMCIAAFRQAVAPYAGRELSDADIIQTFGLNEEGMIRQVVEGGAWRQALEDFYAAYEQRHALCPKPFDGMAELIADLKACSRHVALITGKGERSCAQTLAQFGMSNCFEHIATGSAEKRHDKASALRGLMEKFGLQAEELAYAGDTVSDITACREAGVLCLSAAWAATPDEIGELQRQNAPHVFTSIEALRAFFTRHAVL